MDISKTKAQTISLRRLKRHATLLMCGTTALAALFIAALALSPLSQANIGRSPSVVEVPTPLLDHHAKSFAFADLKGKAVVLHFAFTGCSVYCPRQTAQLAVLHENLSGHYASDQFAFVSVTLTPETDSPKEMNKFAERFSIDEPNWHFATGEKPAIDYLIDRVSAKVIDTGIPGEVDHTTNIYIISTDGSLHSTHVGIPVDNEELTRSVQEVLTSQG